MDIMLGNWVRSTSYPPQLPWDRAPSSLVSRRCAQARDNLGALDEQDLKLFQQVIDMENPDLYRWLTGQDEVPETIENKVLHQLCRDLRYTVAPKVTVPSTSSFEGKVWE